MSRTPSERHPSGVPVLDEGKYKLYDMGELAKVLGVSSRYIARLRDLGAPFICSRTRPEWVLDWMCETLKAKGSIDGKVCSTRPS